MGHIDAQHQLQACIPAALSPGPVRRIILIPKEDEAGAAWMQGVAREWAAELDDPHEDLYTLADGTPVDATR